MQVLSGAQRANAQLIASILISSLLFRAAPGLDFEACKQTQEDILHVEPVLRLQQLGKVSDSPFHLERTFLSKAALEAGRLIQSWMEDAGMVTWMDAVGNVHGRVAGVNASAPALLIGSHLDTVIDAGIYDGALGIVVAIAAVKALHTSGQLRKLHRPIEIIAFSDEEGVRFQSTFLGSAAIAGQFPLQHLHASDKRGVMLESVLQAAALPGTAESLLDLKYDQDSVWAYVEVHIEQGPVLENRNIPLGVVAAIAGQTRLSVKLKGSQGHAGTVPMAVRRDPMTAAAAAIVSIEHICKHPEEYLKRSWEQNEQEHLVSEGALVCTVGELATWPGASNVIPGEVVFTIDIRAEDDSVRANTISTIAQHIQETCQDRHISWDIEVKHEASAVKCNSDIQRRLHRAARYALRNLPDSGLFSDQQPVPVLVSGAGHDAMMMADLTEIGMLFVRCTGGISHSPAEHVLEEDVWAASLAVKTFLENEILDYNDMLIAAL